MSETALKRADNYLTFAPNTSEAHAVESIADDVRKSAAKHARKLMNKAMRIANVEEATVAHMLLREIVRQLASQVDDCKLRNEESIHEEK